MIYTINQLEATEHLGKALAICSGPGGIITLQGELGAGKTTLSQFIGKHLDVTESITSPTFSIIKEYEGRIPFYHMDAYRIQEIDELYELDIDKYLYSQGVIIIEWPEILQEILPENHIKITLTFNYQQGTREAYIEGKGIYYECLRKELKKDENTGD